MLWTRRNWLAQAGWLLGGASRAHAASPPEGRVRFAILGDRTGLGVPEAYLAAWRDIDLLQPDFVINVGDVIEGKKDETAEREWAEMRRVLEPYQRYPLYLTPGNHDIWSERSREVFGRFNGRRPPYGFDFGGVHVTVLDNAGLSKWDDAQLAFLERDLSGRRDRAAKFVFFHKSFWAENFAAARRDPRFHELARRHGVHSVFSGHSHRFRRQVRDGVAYIQVGSSGAKMGAPPAGADAFAYGQFYHHLMVTVDRSGVRCIVRELAPPFGKGRLFDSADWLDDGPRPSFPAAGQ